MCGTQVLCLPCPIPLREINSDARYNGVVLGGWFRPRDVWPDILGVVGNTGYWRGAVCAFFPKVARQYQRQFLMLGAERSIQDTRQVMERCNGKADSIR